MSQQRYNIFVIFATKYSCDRANASKSNYELRITNYETAFGGN
jgi:hypothetical protein